MTHLGHALVRSTGLWLLLAAPVLAYCGRWGSAACAVGLGVVCGRV